MRVRIGRGLLYRDGVHTIHGQSESMKSWLALTIVTTTVQSGLSVLMLDFEEAGADEIGYRLGLLGLTRDQMTNQVEYEVPEGPPDATGVRDLMRNKPAVVVIDSAAGALAEMRRTSTSNDDVNVWFRAMVFPMVRESVVGRHRRSRPAQGCCSPGRLHRCTEQARQPEWSQLPGPPGPHPGTGHGRRRGPVCRQGPRGVDQEGVRTASSRQHSTQRVSPSTLPSRTDPVKDPTPLRSPRHGRRPRAVTPPSR